MNDREQRGLAIAATCRINRKGPVWIVPSQSGDGRYTVVPHAETPHCTCPDHETRGCKCKHIYAVEFVMKREIGSDGVVVDTRQVVLTEKRVTYPQQWEAYNAAQTTEKSSFRVLLHNLCKGLQDPPMKNGRPRLPLRDSIFAACYKVYSTFSGRRFMTDLREAQSEGFINRCPCYNSIFGVLESEETFEILRSLVVASALPLKSLETNFSCDSSGFSGCRFDRWFDKKYGPEGVAKTRRAWVKCHVMCGTKTNVVTAVEIHDQHAGDTTQLQPLLETTRQGFDIGTLSADMAYSSRANLTAIDNAGAFPLIPFKSNAVPGDGGLWQKMFHYCRMHSDEFLSRYHVRSNVESTFSMIKRKFGDGVRSKTDMAMKNEVLAKLVCHNICCVIQEMHESGVDPTFWAQPTTTGAIG